jgi:4'-phosphopantetheinyl transferase EntD
MEIVDPAEWPARAAARTGQWPHGFSKMNTFELARLFTVPVAVCIATEGMYNAPLHPIEEAAVLRAVPKRRREFAAGRACARQALARLGAVAGPIPRGADGAPVWPRGVLGSIAHCDGLCAAVAAWEGEVRSIGLDLEVTAPLDSDLVTYVCNADEIDRLRTLPFVSGVDWPKLIFSAKEAFYKCYHPLARTFLDFREVSVTVDVTDSDTMGTFSAVINPDKPARDRCADFAGRWAVHETFVCAGVTLR